MRILCDDETNEESEIYYIRPMNEARKTNKDISALPEATTITTILKKNKNKKRKNTALNEAVKDAAQQGLNAMIDLFERKEPELIKKGKNLRNKIKSWTLPNFTTGKCPGLQEYSIFQTKKIKN